MKNPNANMNAPLPNKRTMIERDWAGMRSLVLEMCRIYSVRNTLKNTMPPNTVCCTTEVWYTTLQ